jgi:hypothetical protein
MRSFSLFALCRAGCMACALLGWAMGAHADDAVRAARTPPLPKYQQECGTCHIAYPPGFLPGASWQRIIDHLPQHFGVDASLDAATVKELSTWLAANAGSGKGAAQPPQDRITRAAWFVREHREISAATWKSSAVKSASNCAACHTQAEKGDFNERNIRIPR